MIDSQFYFQEFYFLDKWASWRSLRCLKASEQNSWPKLNLPHLLVSVRC